MAQVAVYLSLGVMLPTSTAAGYFLGVLLDEAFHTHFLYIPLLILGIVAGLVELIRQLTRDTRNDSL